MGVRTADARAPCPSLRRRLSSCIEQNFIRSCRSNSCSDLSVVSPEGALAVSQPAQILTEARVPGEVNTVPTAEGRTPATRILDLFFIYPLAAAAASLDVLESVLDRDSRGLGLALALQPSSHSDRSSEGSGGLSSCEMKCVVIHHGATTGCSLGWK